MVRKGPSRRDVRVDWKALDIVHPDAAGIDIGSREHWVAISPEKDEQTVRWFGCFTADVERMADWLQSRGVRSAVIQSTGVYWMPVMENLQQRGMEVYVALAPGQILGVPRVQQIRGGFWRVISFQFSPMRGWMDSGAWGRRAVSALKPAPTAASKLITDN